MVRHEDYSFIVVRHLRRIPNGSNVLLTLIIDLLLRHLSDMTHFIEWTECDELLATHFAIYTRLTMSPGWILRDILSQYVCVDCIVYDAHLTN